MRVNREAFGSGDEENRMWSGNQQDSENRGRKERGAGFDRHSFGVWAGQERSIKVHSSKAHVRRIIDEISKGFFGSMPK
jgi:hypothetical protein